MVLKWIITHLFLCNYSQFDKHRKPKSTFFMELNPAPFLTHQGAIEHDGFNLKTHLSKDSFICAVEQQLFWSCTRSFWQENAAEHFSPGRPQAPPMPSFGPLFWSCLWAVRGKLHLWVSRPRSVYFCIRRKGDGFVGGEFGAKQTAKVSTLKANTTPCLNYTPWALQFSHTLARSPLSPIPSNTPVFLFFWPS